MEDQPAFDPATDFVIAEIDGRQVANAGVDRASAWRHGRLRDVGPCRPGVAPARARARAAARERARAPASAPPRPDGAATRGRVAVVRPGAEVGHRASSRSRGLRRPSAGSSRWPARPEPRSRTRRCPTASSSGRSRPTSIGRSGRRTREAFRDHWRRASRRRGLQSHLRQAPTSTPSLWVVPGTATRSPASSRHGSGRTRTRRSASQRGWLEHISVRRPWRRRGLGRALTAGSAAPAARRRHDRGDARGRCRQPDRRARAVRVDSASRSTSARRPWRLPSALTGRARPAVA